MRSKTKNLKIVSWSITILAIFMFLLYAAVHYESTRFFSDRYLWYVNLGNRQVELDNLEKAEKYSDKALEMDPYRYEANRLKVRVLINRGDYQQATPYLEKIQDEMGYYYFKGSINYNFHEFDEAEKYFFKGIENEPSFYGNYLSLGILYLKMEQMEKAENIFSEGIELVKETEENLKERELGLGYLYSGMRHVYEVRGEFEKAGEYALISESYCMSCSGYISDKLYS